ncbi:MAG: helix-turn-helix transcriptional regulator [Acidobacteria bacterium]|nr:helix-turn-helix transcriptional regulator [Acidobacteriota bacterium]
MTERAYFDQYLDEQAEDEEFRRGYELVQAQIAAVDEIVRRIDAARIDLGMSKADLARAMGVKPSAVRRLLTEHSSNPTIGTLAKAAYAVGLEITVVPAKQDRSGRRAGSVPA